MFIDKKRETCNSQYARLLESIRNKEDMNNIHSAFVNLAEALVSLGRIAPEYTEKANAKAIFLIKMAKTINSTTRHNDLYYQLTGEKIDEESATFQENVDEEKIENDDNLVEVKSIPKVINVPVEKNSSESIKPESFEEYVGQENIKSQLKEMIEASKITKRPLEHILLFGSAGLGKTSLSKVIANEMGAHIIFLSGPTIRDPQTLVDVIKDVKRGDIVFIDEIHRVNPAAAEAIYTVMEDFELTYIERNKEKNIARHVSLQPFTIIGATTHSGLLEKPMRDRFSLQFKMDLYTLDELCKIATNWFKKVNRSIDEDAAYEIAKRSRGVPRICNGFLKRINVKAVVKNISVVDKALVLDFFNTNGIDANGLQNIDVEYMKLLRDKFGGRPVGIDNIAACLGEGKNIIENQVEPFLLYKGFIQITPGGRMLSLAGQQYLDGNEDNA